jgi:hypothetical protein
MLGYSPGRMPDERRVEVARDPSPAALLARLAVDVSAKGGAIGAWLVSDTML